MRRLLFALAALLALSSPSHAAGQRPADMTSSGAIVGTQIVWCPIGTTSDLKCTFTQVATFINSLFSGDFTCTSGGACTLKNTGPGATGPIGSTTVVPVITIDAQGRVTALTSATAAGTVSSVATTCGLTGGTITTTGTLSSTVTARNVTATTDTITSADCGKAVTESNASPVAVAITTAGFSTGNYFTGKNLGAGVATYTPSAGTINGLASIACGTNQSFDAYFDGTNFITLANTCNPVVTLALATGAIGSAACTSAQTVAYPGLLTTDVPVASFNGDPTAVTGYVPLTTGMLAIIVYPTANTINVKVCNNTSASITPGAITLNLARAFR